MKISDMLNDDIKTRLNQLYHLGQQKEEKEPSTQREWREMMGEFKKTVERNRGTIRNTNKRFFR